MTAVEVWLGGDLYAWVDESDRTLVEPYTWEPLRSGEHLIYARARIEGTTRRLMHNFITGWGQCDHINGNGLDNRRANLRPATRSQNMANRRKGANGSSRFKGVFWQKQCHRWLAQVGIEGRRVYLGLFDDEEAAARAYDQRAREAFGEYAALNFPRPGEASCLR